jgi:signal peptidase I
MGSGPKDEAMARVADSSDDDEEEKDEEEEDDQPPPRRSRAHASRKPPPRDRPHPIKKWSKDSDAGEEEEADSSAGPAARPRVFWRARDSLYFGPLVALAIVILLVVSLFAFTQNWPPVYVVESESMQHGYSDVLGVINTGDLVLAQKVANSTIQPYVVAQQTGYSTYGEYGDVLLYYPDGNVGTPIIHRAILFLEWVPSAQAYSAPSLAGLPCGNQSGAIYATPGTMEGSKANCAWSNLKSTLDLFHVGWADVNVSIALTPNFLGEHSGYVTMGDNNIEDGSGTYDQSPGFQLSELVEPGWVIGVARGMIPWVGALKLWIEGSSTTGEVPPQSWQFLGLTFAGIILLAFGLHYALRVEGIEDPRRKAEEDEEEAEEQEEEGSGGGSASRARHFLRSIRPWGASDDEEEEDDLDPSPTSKVPTRKPARASRPHRGRPPPKVRRPPKAKHPPTDDDDT